MIVWKIGRVRSLVYKDETKIRNENFGSGGYMKKITKRIVCSALALTMLSTLAIERTVRMSASDLVASNNATASADTLSFKNVTGKYDTSKLMQENFNSHLFFQGWY